MDIDSIKLFNEVKSLAIASGMIPAQAHYLARLATGHANEIGLAEVSLGQVAWAFTVQLRDFNREWPGTLKTVFLPSGLSASYLEAMRKEAENAKSDFTAIEAAYAEAWDEECALGQG